MQLQKTPLVVRNSFLPFLNALGIDASANCPVTSVMDKYKNCVTSSLDTWKGVLLENKSLRIKMASCYYQFNITIGMHNKTFID